MEWFEEIFSGSIDCNWRNVSAGVWLLKQSWKNISQCFRNGKRKKNWRKKLTTENLKKLTTEKTEKMETENSKTENRNVGGWLLKQSWKKYQRESCVPPSLLSSLSSLSLSLLSFSSFLFLFFLFSVLFPTVQRVWLIKERVALPCLRCCCLSCLFFLFLLPWLLSCFLSSL